ncbi:MAG: hypothetical protein JWQ85_2912 [Mucilaginibacter sp.]|nr:hypothetical protein [Mucilaginibacter sp.]
MNEGKLKSSSVKNSPQKNRRLPLGYPSRKAGAKVPKKNS